MENDKEMYEEYATISWCPADLKEMYPQWSDEMCMEVLSRESRYLEDRLIELGWEVLENLTASYNEYDGEDNA